MTDAYVPLTGPPAWRHAACRGEDPELWFPMGHHGREIKFDVNDDGETAPDICRRCPYRGELGECATWARHIKATAGIWGGLDMEERHNQREPKRCALDGCGNPVAKGRVKYCSELCLHEADRRGTLERERRKRHEKRQAALR
jgi:WhiB family redox-sensing transcriptional regulator